MVFQPSDAINEDSPIITAKNLAENLETLISRFTLLASSLREENHFPPRQDLPTTSQSKQTQLPLARWIDHTLLKPEATRADITRVCAEAREHGFATVCVNSSWISYVSQLLQGSTTLPIAVVGFPLGVASTSSKAFETREAIREGAREIDMVIHVGALKAGEYSYVIRDIRAVVEAAAPYPVKVILETSSLTLEEKIAACTLSKEAGAAFVKTSTGFASGGATLEDIALMRRVVGDSMGVKASGGIRSYEDARRMIHAGANRIGASSSVAIVMKARTQSEGY